MERKSVVYNGVTYYTDRIYYTTDYDMFNTLEGNRDVTSNKKLRKSIEENGFEDIAITVNEKFEIIEGQTRVKEIKEFSKAHPDLDKPEIAFYVRPGFGIKECKIINTTNRPWKTPDNLKMYRYFGNNIEQYKAIQHYGAIYPQLRIEQILQLFSRGGNSAKIKEGELQLVDDLGVTCEYAQLAIDIKQLMNRSSQKGMSGLCKALATFRNKGIAPDKLEQSVMKNAPNDPSFIYVCDYVAWKRFLIKMYNKGRKSGRLSLEDFGIHD